MLLSDYRFILYILDITFEGSYIDCSLKCLLPNDREDVKMVAYSI